MTHPKTPDPLLLASPLPWYFVIALVGAMSAFSTLLGLNS